MKNVSRPAFLFVATSLIATPPQVKCTEVPQEDIAQVMRVAQVFKTTCEREFFDGAPPLFFYYVASDFCHSMGTNLAEVESILDDIRTEKFSQRNQDTITRWTRLAREAIETTQKSCEDALRSTSTYPPTNEPELLRQLFLPFGEFLRAHASYFITSTLAFPYYHATRDTVLEQYIGGMDIFDLEESWEKTTNRISDWLNKHIIPSSDSDYEIFEKRFMPEQMAVYYQPQVNKYGEYTRLPLSIGFYGGHVYSSAVVFLYDYYEHRLSSFHDHDHHSASSVESSPSETIPHSREKRLSDNSITSD